MSYSQQTEMIECDVDGVSQWMKIIDDSAFIDIIEGWKISVKETYLKHIVKKDVVIQAGGYCGIFPRLLSQIFDTVYTFEPDPLNFFCLTNNCQESNIIKAQGALGDSNELITPIIRVNTNRGMNVVLHDIASKIPTYRIDDFALKSCDFIQLDTEGHEYKILKGAIKTIDKFRPVISVEDTNNSIENLLKDFGYSKRDKTFRDTIYATE